MSKNQYGRVRTVGSRDNQYPNGYWDKITYWSSKLNEAIAEKNLRGADSAHRKLDYFIGREWEANPTMQS
jgi:hypothetical protein|tara:strand:- start:47 stop:256 length:210 start_codon:yes stop_codon:yes gene_type:complete